jgi:hypothetical protein
MPQPIERFASCVVLAMMLCLVLPSCHATGASDAGTGPRLHVLFVGNSLTSQNDLPGMIAALARSRGRDLQYEVHAPGGYRLSQHASDPRLLEKIDRGSWDVVVLQEQSQMPGVPRERLEREVYPFARVLSDRIRAASPRAKIAFYATMAKRNGDAQFFPNVPEMGSYAGMQRRINASYAEMAKDNRGLLVPVGSVWEKARAEKPAIELYADETHPSLPGTYLAACVFYAVIFEHSPVGASHPRGIDDATAALLQKIAEAGRARVER